MVIGFDTSDVWQAQNRGFQMGTVQPDGVVIHLTGQVAWSPDEDVIGKDDVEAQTHQIFQNISKLLKRVGGDLSDLVATTTYFTDRQHLPKIQRIRAEYLLPGTEPTSTSVMVGGLGHEDFLVEVTSIAVIPHRRFVPPSAEPPEPGHPDA